MLQNPTYLFVAASLLLSVGCTRSSDPSSAPTKLIVAVSVPPQVWLVEQVGGEHVEVLPLVQPSDDPHTYQPSDAQVSRVMQADVYFRVGVPFESGAWFEAIRSSGKIPIVDTREGAALIPMQSHAHHEEADDHGHDDDHEHHAGADPHIWLSPRLLRIQAGTIARTLADIDPARRAEYEGNLADLARRLDELDAKIHALLDPLAGKAFFVFHPAWGYFAAEYGLEQIAVEIEGKQPSDAELTELAQKARQLGAKVIFVQPQITGRAAEALATAVGARVETLDPLAEDVAANLLSAAEAIAHGAPGETE
ncbi:MAG: zinc ABC transporter solute-binding protein [Rhodopirellula sp.]|nr:zinc ABC transporter solute-binding protein [Rhodopirellula sp.]